MRRTAALPNLASAVLARFRSRKAESGQVTAMTSMTLRKARKEDGPAVFELLWAARDEIPLKPIFYNDQNKRWTQRIAKKGIYG
jgi:hypothetical protein